MKRSTRILIPALLLAAIAGFLPACNKEAVQLAYDKQETNIASFVEAQRRADETATVTYKDGVVRVVLHDTLTREGLLADLVVWSDNPLESWEARVITAYQAGEVIYKEGDALKCM